MVVSYVGLAFHKGWNKDLISTTLLATDTTVVGTHCFLVYWVNPSIAVIPLIDAGFHSPKLRDVLMDLFHF